VIGNATLKFVNRDTNVLLCTAPVGLVNPLDKQNGTAACNAVLPTGDYHVGLIVGGYYVRDDATRTTRCWKSRRVCGTGSISGGGYLVLATPAGAFAGDVGSKNNFGFNVKYNKPKTSLQGSINTIIRKAGRLYQVKGNAMTSLVIDDKITAAHPYPTATFFGKAPTDRRHRPAQRVRASERRRRPVEGHDVEPQRARQSAATRHDRHHGLVRQLRRWRPVLLQQLGRREHPRTTPRRHRRRQPRHPLAFLPLRVGRGPG
jgi:hypothetical protein